MTQLIDGPAETADDTPIVDEASADARQAAARAGCEVRELASLDELHTAIAIFRQVWGRPGEADIVPIEMLRALSHAGNYAAGAFCDDTMAGAVVGFLGTYGRRVNLHSHVMGLLPERRSRGMGFALKLHQRSWALARGLRTITWTFDPLVRRNAYFNLVKLGAEATEYHSDFYGEMDDAINSGDATDRLLVTWSLRSSPAHAASRGRRLEERVADAAHTATLLEADERGRPLVHEAEGPYLRCHVPEDIVDLRDRDPELATVWRLALRETLGAALHDGHRAVGATRDGWYLLEHRDAQQT